FPQMTGSQSRVAPGEWFLDTKNKTVYYKARAGEDMTKAEVIAPGIETLLRVEGTLDRPVRNLRFRGLTFAHSTWTKPSQSGILNMQTGMYNTKVEAKNMQWTARPPAAVYVAAAERPVFERNVFCHLGAAGLDFHYGVRQGEIVGNVFEDISGNAVQLAPFKQDDQESHVPYKPTDSRDICAQDTIRNNYFTKCGQDYYGSVAVACGYPLQVVIEHNEIADVPYSGISVGWGWLKAPGVMRENKIRYNRVHHFLTKLTDGAAIYTISAQPDSEIAYNYIYDLVFSPSRTLDWSRAIYLDEGSDGFAVHHNVIDVPKDYFAKGNKRVHRNKNGPNNKIYDNESHDKTIKQDAGLEPAYRNIKPQ
ncbi:MAG: right-handed parallel beta-helix repeat-containing protein, partial [Thermoguttaceae bacterium]